MPAFNSSAAFREASGFSREYGAWNFEQFKAALERMNSSGQISDQLRDQVIAYAQQQIDQGFASPEDISAISQQLMPQLEEAIARRGGRLDSIQDMFDSRVSTGQTMDTVYNNQNEQAGDITRTGEESQGLIDGFAGRAAGREDDASNRIFDDLGRSYDGSRSGVNDTFGGLRQGNAAVGGSMLERLGRDYGGMRERSGTAFDGMNARNTGTTRDLIRDSDTAFRDLAQDRDATYARQGGRMNETIDSIEGGNRDTYGRLQGGLDETVEGIGGNITDTMTGLEGSSEETYNTALAEAQRLDPMNEGFAQRAARSFAPAVASRKANLRRRGISALDPQYAEAMRDIEMDRAQMMDESKLSAMGDSVDRQNALRVGAQNARERLGTGRLDRETDNARYGQEGTERLQTQLRSILDEAGLTRYTEGRNLDLSRLTDTERQRLEQVAQRRNLSIDELDRSISLAQNQLTNEQGLTEREGDRNRQVTTDTFNRETDLAVGQNDRTVDLNREQSGIYRGEIQRNTAAQQGIDAGYTEGSLSNLDNQFDRTQNWRAQGNQNALLQRALETEDFQTAADLLREQNGEEITAIDLRNMSQDRGINWLINNYARQNAGAANLANTYAREGARQSDAAQTARGFGADAESAYATTRQQEAGRGNWGWRLLGGAAQAGLSFIPGVGPALGGIAGGLIGGINQPGAGSFGAQAGGQNRGGAYGGAPGATAYNFGYQTPNLQWPTTPRTPSFQPNGTSYSGGQMLPNGTFQVRR